MWRKVSYFLVDGGLEGGIPDHGILIRGMLLHATIGGTINSVANGKVAVFSYGIYTFEQVYVFCKSKYIIYKLKEMGKIAEEDLMQICNRFDMLDNAYCGKLTIADLMESDTD
ncbi:hypothetical protein RHGRI_021751 [Rhododendron griersonianum]|uniref:EF-hand domain-containing protein n=1 Tax=Rhododendron griersonianum TaxID=479676 RepID=A0AAV6JN49_9ERIC|nr:hypothetical protein RHGRI_021751 [Rhododendron griersonianum]